ncbi:Calx-beta domain-containing protein, partial [Vibrio furnissii]
MSVNSLVFSGILSANQMIVIDVNGNIRTALIGEKLPQGTVIVQRGDDISDEAALKTQIIDANNNPQDITDDVARIFAALEEGQDPTQVDEELAPAAGGGQGSALTAAATVERIGSETIAITSFDTTGFESLGLSQTQSLALSSVLVTSAASSADATSENPTVSTISSSEVDEGQDAVFTVSLSNESTSAQTYSFSLSDGTAGSADYGTVTFGEGVTDNGDGTITVDAGVTSFTATVATTDDTIDEANETFTLTVGGQTGTATIVDNDEAPTITGVSDAVVSANDATVDEGQDAVFTVSLSNESTSAQTYSFSLSDGTAGSADYGTVTFGEGVTDNGDGTITVDAGVTSFTATVATTDDTIDEANETFTLTVGGQTGTATIVDNDEAP